MAANSSVEQLQRLASISSALPPSLRLHFRCEADMTASKQGLARPFDLADRDFCSVCAARTTLVKSVSNKKKGPARKVQLGCAVCERPYAGLLPIVQGQKKAKEVTVQGQVTSDEVKVPPPVVSIQPQPRKSEKKKAKKDANAGLTIPTVKKPKFNSAKLSAMLKKPSGANGQDRLLHMLKK